MLQSLLIVPSSYLTGVTLSPTPVTLTTADGRPIETLGQVKLNIGIPSLRRVFTWTFVAAKTTNALLGYDFLSENGLVVDCKRKCIRDGATSCTASVVPLSKIQNIVINPIDSLPTSIQRLLKETPSLLTPSKSSGVVDAAALYHRIHTGSHPAVYAKPRQLNPEKEAVFAINSRPGKLTV